MPAVSFAARSQELFPCEPFPIQHQLAGHPLMTLEALAALTAKLAGDRVEFNGGKLKPDQRPENVPTLDSPPADIVRQIETSDAWMVLKNVEVVPEYRALIASFLDETARSLGYHSAATAGMKDFQGFIFVASANAVTPFHIDYEENFFVHIAGDKFMHVFDNRDRSLIPEAELEVYPGKHRNLPYREDFESRATVFTMQPGDGLFLPYTWPHWVRTGDSHAISIAITWKSRQDIRQNGLYFTNAVMRKLGLPQPEPGKHRWYDSAKIAAFSSARIATAPFRRSEIIRRNLRRLLFGRKANYYYRETRES